MTLKAPPQTEKTKRSSSPPLHGIKIVNRDPRLHRMAHHSSHAEDQSHGREYPLNMTSQPDTKANETTQAEKQNSTKQVKLKASGKTEGRAWPVSSKV